MHLRRHNGLQLFDPSPDQTKRDGRSSESTGTGEGARASKEATVHTAQAALSNGRRRGWLGSDRMLLVFDSRPLQKIRAMRGRRMDSLNYNHHYRLQAITNLVK